MKTRLFSLWLLLSVAIGLSAYDFKADRLCYNITSSELPYTVEVTYEQNPNSNWGWSAYEHLTTADIPKTVTFNYREYCVTSIGGYAFKDCRGLTSITIPNSVTTIGESAFRDCTGLTSITIGNSVTSIGGWAFDGCNNLKSVSINSDGIVSVNRDNPSSISSIFGLQVTEYILGDDVHSIGNYTFYKNVNLISVSIGNSVTNIGGSAFEGCTGLTSITIPNSVTSIGNSAFEGCKGLTSITIPNSVTSIGGWAFDGCTSLTSITIPNSVTSIGERAFEGCTSLTSITIPNSVTSIGGWAFFGCTGLTSITIPNSVTSIGWRAFSGCTGLTSVTIPNSVTSIGERAFDGCKGLTSITIPNSVTNIHNEAFANCSSLISVTIGNGVTNVGASVFRGCNSLTSVTWNAKAYSDFDNERNTPFYCNVYYGDDWYLNFDIRSQITSFTFGDSVQHIPAYLCEQMTNLTSVTIPNSVTSIGYSAFRGCTGLTKVNYIGDVKGWLAIDMNSNPISYSHNLYINNKLVTDLVIPEGVTDISSNLAQYTGLTSITIPNSVISISGSAFSGCKNVETVVFGSAVETIGASAFAGCQSIYEMTIYATKVPTIQENTFAGVGTGATLRVPAGCAKKYKAHPYWGVFNIEEIPSEYTITVTCDPKQGQVTGGGTYPYGSKATLTATPNNGYEFKQWSDGSTANPYSFLVEKDMTIEALFEPTTPIENVVAEEHIAPRKVFRNGQVYILRGGKTYTLTGVEVNL